MSENSSVDFLSGFSEIQKSINDFDASLAKDVRVFQDLRSADYQYEVLMDRIKEFEENLDDDHEIAVKLASFGQSITLSVTDIGYSNPSIIVFHGYVEGKRATLIQHISQLSFLLVSVPKSDPDKPARRIGFDLSSHRNEQ